MCLCDVARENNSIYLKKEYFMFGNDKKKILLKLNSNFECKSTLTLLINLLQSSKCIRKQNLKTASF